MQGSCNSCLRDKTKTSIIRANLYQTPQKNGLTKTALLKQLRKK